MAESGMDIRPLVAQAPGVAALASAGRQLLAGAESIADDSPTKAASWCFKSSLFLAQAGLAGEAESARADAFRQVGRAVHSGVDSQDLKPAGSRWHRAAVEVSAPIRIDFGGGWSDTPPFCIDWGGTVLNAALTLEGEYPIRARVRRIEEPLIRCLAGEDGQRTAEWRLAEELRVEMKPGSPFAVPAVALQMTGMFEPPGPLADTLAGFGGGLEFTTVVDVPMGSGLGTSSILGATVIRSLAEMLGVALSDASLVDQVSALEQKMTTGGGWQDQAGGVFPGAKLVTSRPGARQTLRVTPVDWGEERQREFEARFVLHYTGIVRVAKDLLTEVVGGYLARDVDKVQVLHNIKSLAVEMAQAMSAGDWDYLGAMMDRHWEMNKLLDPHTTNAAIEACLRDVRPFLSGAKLAGAGGGGFLMLLAKSPESARDLREHLSSRDDGGHLFRYGIANQGLKVEIDR
jgi:fucokinase